jgi:hypothetical protein
MQHTKTLARYHGLSRDGDAIVIVIGVGRFQGGISSVVHFENEV